MCKLLKNFGNFQDHNSTSLRTAQQKKPLSHSLQFPGQSSVPTQGSKIYFAADLWLWPLLSFSVPWPVSRPVSPAHHHPELQYRPCAWCRTSWHSCNGEITDLKDWNAVFRNSTYIFRLCTNHVSGWNLEAERCWKKASRLYPTISLSPSWSSSQRHSLHCTWAGWGQNLFPGVHWMLFRGPTRKSMIWFAALLRNGTFGKRMGKENGWKRFRWNIVWQNQKFVFRICGFIWLFDKF